MAIGKVKYLNFVIIIVRVTSHVTRVHKYTKLFKTRDYHRRNVTFLYLNLENLGEF